MTSIHTELENAVTTSINTVLPLIVTGKGVKEQLFFAVLVPLAVSFSKKAIRYLVARTKRPDPEICSISILSRIAVPVGSSLICPTFVALQWYIEFISRSDTSLKHKETKPHGCNIIIMAPLENSCPRDIKWMDNDGKEHIIKVEFTPEKTEELSKGIKVVSESFVIKHQSITVLEEFLDWINDKYQAHQAATVSGIYVYQCNSEGNWERGNRLNNKSFDNLFLRKQVKESLLCDLDKFTKSKQLYERMSQPFRRGYLFYGRPGCGKTATVYAIANYLHHHVYFVKSRIADSNPDILEKALKSIPERSIVFFDDVDVMQCANARKPFNNGDNEPGSDDGNNRQPQNSQSQVVVLKGNNQQDIKRKQILGTLLSCLDGYDCLRNCIVIMASNYPDDLDFALVRPGRIDMKIEFGSCTMEQLVDMCTNFMGEEKAKLCIEDVDTRKFEAKQFSVADIISNVVLPYHDDVKQINIKLKQMTM